MHYIWCITLHIISSIFTCSYFIIRNTCLWIYVLASMMIVEICLSFNVENTLKWSLYQKCWSSLSDVDDDNTMSWNCPLMYWSSFGTWRLRDKDIKTHLCGCQIVVLGDHDVKTYLLRTTPNVYVVFDGVSEDLWWISVCDNGVYLV